ncbi:MAG: phosphoglycerate dehydrogenase [Hyphomicrobiales bacterium]|nr:phosphoglycerate dehydrogenase [Hyphomicrobiales bacterium]
MASALSRPKEKIKILLLEGIADTAVEALNAAGYAHIERHRKALKGDELRMALDGVSMLGIRSRTQLTADVLDGMRSVIAVGCFSVGTNQVDLDATRNMGIPVFNAPFSNTRSVAELTIAEIIMLFRGIFPKSAGAHRGDWMKQARGSHEVRGKTLGIIGYGNIGSQLSALAEAMGMQVIFYDPTDKLNRGNVVPCATLTKLLAESDVVSIHVPETAETRGMMGAGEFAAMKAGSFFINNARGTVFDDEALAASLKMGHLAGAAIDVFPAEPASNDDRFASPLQGLENVILTPHVGGSTQEAQQRIGSEVARKLIDYSDIGSTFGAVNFPQVQLPSRPTGTRFIQVHENVPGQISRLNEIFSRRQINISAQYFQSDGHIGYVVLEADGAVDDATGVLKEIRALPGTVRARMLYRRD